LTWAAWLLAPSKIDSLGRNLQKGFTHLFQKELSAAQKALKQSNERPFEKLLFRLDDTGWWPVICILPLLTRDLKKNSIPQTGEVTL